MKKPYYLHFADNISAEALCIMLQSADPVCDVKPVFPGSFAVLTDLSFSAFKHLLDVSFPSASRTLVLVRKADTVFALPDDEQPDCSSTGSAAPFGG